ncbi:MAG: hypothetical protein AAFR26_04500 [Cyanobacteria bacterium J06626_4]
MAKGQVKVEVYAERFLAQVETIEGRHRQFSKLTSTLPDLTLLRIAIAA